MQETVVRFRMLMTNLQTYRFQLIWWKTQEFSLYNKQDSNRNSINIHIHMITHTHLNTHTLYVLYLYRFKCVDDMSRVAENKNNNNKMKPNFEQLLNVYWNSLDVSCIAGTHHITCTQYNSAQLNSTEHNTTQAVAWTTADWTNNCYRKNTATWN